MSNHLHADDRLAILRATDKFRNWDSLDDQRICILCDRTFSGRQVGITRSRFGHFHLHCPTDSCTAGPNQWVYPGNPLVSDTVFEDWWHALNSDVDQPLTKITAKSPKLRHV